MSNQFSTYQIGEVAEIIAGGDKPKVFSLEKKAPVSIPVLANAEKDNGLMGYTDNARIFEHAVTVAARGSNVGFVAIRKEPFFPVVRLLSLIPKKERLDVDYLFYNLKQNRKTGTGSGQPQITIPDISNKTISLPPISVQKKVADVLSVLDAKIELNNRINAELEAMAKTLYDYWFVQFDFPDANGKPYKTSGGKMVYNPTLKREIPEGWSDGTLGEIAELYQPKTISEKEMTEDGEFLVYGANGIVGRYAQYNHEQSVVAVTCRGNSCGEINVTRPYSWITGNAMIVNTHSHLLPPTYIYNLLRSSGLENVITGSAQPQITRTNLAPMKIIRPAEKVLTNYARFVKPNFEKRIEILDENEKLEKLRDWLLPMLMNGQGTVTSSTQSKAKEA